MKSYKILYSKNGNHPITLEVKTIRGLNKILNSDACNSKVYSKPSENMPIKMHNRIADHNKTLTEN